MGLSAGQTVRSVTLGLMALSAIGGQTSVAQGKTCQKVVLEGEAKAGQEWKTGIGEGWVFRVLPIQAGKAGYSGWDLVVDREQPAGFPDALLVATPPYNSINEREVGTTFGLRAQDAVGWNPRSFHFLVNEAAFRESQKAFMQLSQGGQAGQASAVRRLMELGRQTGAGEFRILDARLVPGVGDPAPYAQNWALALSRTPHTFEPAAQGPSSPLGEVRWVRFSVALWLPSAWKLPKELHAVRAGCSE